MGDEKIKTNLENTWHLTYQRRLSNYLRTFRFRNNISSKGMAVKLDYASSRYSRLESESIPFDRFISSVDFLKTLADIEGLSFSEFATMLEGSQGKEKNKSSKWKSKLVDIFENIGSKTMRGFLAVANTDSKQEKEELELAIELYVRLKNGKLSSEAFKSLVRIMQELTGKGN